MPKALVTVLFVLCTLIGLSIIFMSMGWFLIVFIIVLPPAMLLHVLAWFRTVKGNPAMYGWVVLSGFVFLVFSLFRIDKDAHGVYNGYSTALYHLGVIESQHVEPWAYSLEVSLILIFGMIVIDALVLRAAAKQNRSLQRGRAVE